MRRTTTAFLVALGIFGARDARADGEAANDPAAEARHQYDVGTQAFAAHRYVEAATAFEAAAAYKAHAVTLYTAALAWEEAGQPERAADDYGRALAVPGLAADQEKSARDKLATMEKKLGVVAVAGPDGARVQLDSLTEVPVPARLHGKPGAHVVSARIEAKPIEKRDVTLEPGQTVNLDVTPHAAPPPAAAPPPKEEPKEERAPGGPGLRKSIGLVAGGVGLATIGAGIVLGIEALDARDTFNASPTHATFDHANGLERWTNIAFIAGGVFLAGGVVLYLWPSSGGEAHAKVGLTPRGAELRGTF